MTDRTHPDSGELDGLGIVPELRAEIERLRAELIAAKADADLTRFQLKESRADEMQAMAYLNEIRDVIGGVDYEHTVKIAAGLKRMVDAMEDQEPMVTKRNKGIVLHVGWDDLPDGTQFYAHPVPSVPDDEALLRQALKALDPCDGVRWGGMGKVRAAAIKALRERLK